MKNVYLFQPNYKYGKSAHLPYAVGTLAAYSWAIPEISENFTLKKIFFLRDNVKRVVDSLENPSVIGFSTYLWNAEYNHALAKKIKEKYPDCVIVFGGHHVPPDNKMVMDCNYIDVAIHSEGEVVFSKLLLAILHGESYKDIPNLSYRENGEIFSTEIQPYCDCSSFPSPYLEGTFDEIIKENPETEFQLLFETNRGCAYRCAYCDWGSLKSKLRLFPLERIHGELDWMCKNKIDFCGNADANFGILDRDMELIDYIIDLKKKTGYPKKFQASYAKNSDDRIFEISKKLQDNGMNKGVTLAFQTMSKDAAEIVGRSNISIDKFAELMKKYNSAGIPTYTELILGLPGETYESFTDGIDLLLQAGQHNAIYVHNCELLPCSEMGSDEYVEKYQIEATKIRLNQPHMPFNIDDEIPEYSNIVTKTFSMSHEDWIKINLFSSCVQCFHHLGLLEFVSIYAYYEEKISYKDFYMRLIEFLLERPESVGGKALLNIQEALEKILSGGGSLVCHDEKFGDVVWPFEEFAFLTVAYESEKFYREIENFVDEIITDEKIRKELLKYQKAMIKLPVRAEKELKFSYDFHSYFSNIFSREYQKLQKFSTVVRIDVENFYDNWVDFARYVVWYGRKDSRNVYTDCVKTERVDA